MRCKGGWVLGLEEESIIDGMHRNDQFVCTCCFIYVIHIKERPSSVSRRRFVQILVERNF